MKQTFLKQLSSVHSNNLVIGVVMEKYKMTAIQVRRAFNKKERREIAK